MYAVIAIATGWKEKRTYIKVSSKPYTIEQARTLRDTIDSGDNNPLIVDESRVDEAIELNNKSL